MQNQDLGQYISNTVAFPLTMVDRIVPATADADREKIGTALGFDDRWPVMTEDFTQWVVEDHFPAGRPDGAATFVSDVGSYETMKLRLLNGSHSCIAYLGYLSGYETVSDAMQDVNLAGFVKRLMDAEATPTLALPAGADVESYKSALIKRFHNPSLRHRTWQIAMDGSQKLSQRLLGTIRNRLKLSAPIDCLALGVAAWMRCVTGTDEKRNPIDVCDPLSTELRKRAEMSGLFAGRLAPALLGIEGIFGKDLPANPTFTAAVTNALDQLIKHGARQTLATQGEQSPIKQTWRWFGPDDLVLLPHITQAGATGIVTALHHMNRGQAWTDDEMLKRKAQIESQGLPWDAVESIAVPENIKTRSGSFGELIENYKSSLRAVVRAGIKIACYNFMTITDWTRTDLFWPLPNGGSALRFDMVDFCAYDALIFKRRNAEADHPADRIAEATKRLASWPESKIAELERNLIDWVPARESVYDRANFTKQLDAYHEINLEGLRQNLFEFVRDIASFAEELGVQLAIHPDDPPFPLFGSPRMNSTAGDTRKLLKAVNMPANDVSLCTGSYGANPKNHLVAMAREFASRIHFAHLRNTTHGPDGSFYEAEHLDGDTDIVGVVAALLTRETRRKNDGRLDAEVPMRPNHGHLIVDDIGKKVNPGYSCIGRLKGLAELRGVMRNVAHFRAGKVA